MENEIFDNPQNKSNPVLHEWYEQWQCPQVMEAPVTPVSPVSPQPEKKQKKKKRLGWLYALLIVILVGGACTATAIWMNGMWQKQLALQSQSFQNRLDVLQSELDTAQKEPVTQQVVVSQEGYLTPGQVYANNMKSVVAVTTSVVESGFYGYNEYESFGSGFIISEDGYVVSNYHVVEGAKSLTVITYDDQEYEAQLVGSDATNDIALLKIDAKNLPYVTIGSSDALMVGDQVAAVGNPLGELTSTLTVGYVSAKDRIVATDGTAINMIQTDAAINSGNSGGPLFNMKGEVVGITTAKYSGTSSSGATIEGIGFAIPIDDVFGMLEDLREFGYVTGAYLGVYVKDVDEYGRSYGLPAGVFVEDVITGFAAEKAGILKGDIIVELGGYKITCMTDLTRALRKFKAGDTTSVTVYRNGQEQYLSVELDEKPQEEQVQPETKEPEVTMPGNFNDDAWEDEFYRYFFGG